MSDAQAAPSGHVDGTGGFGEREAAGEGGFTQRALVWVEKAGNRVPHPAILFLALCIGVIVLSQILDWPTSASPARSPATPTRQPTRPQRRHGLPYHGRPATTPCTRRRSR